MLNFYVHDTNLKHMTVYATCDKCGHRVNNNAFCTECGERVAFPFYENYTNPSFLEDLVRECLAKLEEACGIKAHIYKGMEGDCYCFYALNTPRCARCERYVQDSEKFCGGCGNRINSREMKELSYILLTEEEMSNRAKEWFYKEHPELRPDEEYNVDLRILVGNEKLDEYEDKPYFEYYICGKKSTVLGLEDVDEWLDIPAPLEEQCIDKIRSAMRVWIADWTNNECPNDFQECFDFKAKCDLGKEHNFLFEMVIREAD